MEPTGTNGRTRHTFQPVWWVGSRPVVVFSLDGREYCFPVVAMTMSGEALVARVRCPVPGPPRSESVVWLVPFAGRSPGGLAVHIGFAVVMAQVRRPVPFRTRKLRPGRGDGTALERVWESSTPPHSTLGFPSSVTLREPHFLFLSRFPWRAGGLCSGRCPWVGFRRILFLFPGGSRRASRPGKPVVLCSFPVPASRDARKAFSDFQSAYLAPKVFYFVPLSK